MEVDALLLKVGVDFAGVEVAVQGEDVGVVSQQLADNLFCLQSATIIGDIAGDDDQISLANPWDSATTPGGHVDVAKSDDSHCYILYPCGIALFVQS